MLHRIPHIDKSDVQRREAKAQDVFVHTAIACAVVANHAARNQRLHHRKRARTQCATRAMLACQAHLRAALRVRPRRG